MMAAPLLPEDVEQILQIHRAGYSNTEISRRTGRGRATVVRYVQREKKRLAQDEVAGSAAAQLSSFDVGVLYWLAQSVVKFECSQCGAVWPRLKTMSAGRCPDCDLQWSIP